MEVLLELPVAITAIVALGLGLEAVDAALVATGAEAAPVPAEPVVFEPVVEPA